MAIHWNGARTSHRRTRGREHVTIALLGFVGACDPGVTISGTVRDSDGGPVSGAVIELKCPPGDLINVGGTIRTTDAGDFRLHGLGCAAPRCVVNVRAPTGEETDYLVGQHCRRRHWLCEKGSCNEVRVEARF